MYRGFGGPEMIAIMSMLLANERTATHQSPYIRSEPLGKQFRKRSPVLLRAANMRQMLDRPLNSDGNRTKDREGLLKALLSLTTSCPRLDTSQKRVRQLLTTAFYNILNEQFVVSSTEPG